MPPTSVVIEPTSFGLGGSVPADFPQLANFSITAQFADAADTIPSWGMTPGTRDRYLREFWPGEPWFAGALYNTVGRYTALGWSLTGGPRTIAAMQEKLNNSEEGAGWNALMAKTLIDLYTQDNGAFIEVVRMGRTESSPLYMLNHLDTAQCVRTGRHKEPIVYYDNHGVGHTMKWFQVIALSEFPSPNERMRGVQYSALTRCLRMAQVMRDIQVYNREKVTGRNPKKIHLVSGLSTRMIEDAMTQHSNTADAQGLIRYIKPLVLGTVDPTAKVDHAEIDMASLPDGFDMDESMKWYITNLALAFGSDYQDFAPLNANGASTGAQSQMSHLKARGKGAALFMTTLQQAFNWHGVMPANVRFQFGEQDPAAELERILLMKETALALQIMVDTGALTTQVARQMLADRGFIPQEYLALMRDPDPTDVITQPGGTRVADSAAVAPGLPGPTEPPGTGAGAPPTPNDANNNNERTRMPSKTQRPSVPGTPGS
jgi:hypothetical protein